MQSFLQLAGFPENQLPGVHNQFGVERFGVPTASRGPEQVGHSGEVAAAAQGFLDGMGAAGRRGLARGRFHGGGAPAPPGNARGVTTHAPLQALVCLPKTLSARPSAGVSSSDWECPEITSFVADSG